MLSTACITLHYTDSLHLHLKTWDFGMNILKNIQALIILRCLKSLLLLNIYTSYN